MTKFLTTSAIASEIEAVVRNAERKVVLVSPYLKFSDNFIQRLQDANRRGVQIHVVYGKTDLLETTRDALAQLDNLHLYDCPNLHAKCYFNERAMVITSMNLYEFSEKNNREMGVLVSSDETLYRDAVNETQSILAASEQQQVKKKRPSFFASLTGQAEKSKKSVSRKKASNKRTHSSKGSCIRCSRSIRHNPEAPFCRDCFTAWARWENPDYREKHCHTCGAEADTSRAKPQCYSCYRSQAA